MGYSLNDLQNASIKLCNLTKIYPDNKDLIKSKIENVAIDKINKIEVKNYYVNLGDFKKNYNQIFESGKIYVINGQSGSGKTTLLNAICGLKEIEKGYLIINGNIKLRNLYNHRDKMVYLFQDSILFDRSLKENMSYPDDNLNKKSNELIKRLEMKKLLKREVRGSIKNILSGGEKKRVDLIRTLNKDKDVYFFDEPTNELDENNAIKVIEEIKKLKNQNKIIIIISHDARTNEIADEIVSL